MPASATPSERAAKGPLHGYRVIELGQIAAGPFAAMLLADLGADVVKVEPPIGDQMRQWPPLARGPEGDEFSYNFASVNRNKRSVVADLKDPAGMKTAQDLIESADILVENYRPGALDRLGLGFADVTKSHRGLIYCSISGFGTTSPYRNDGAYDVIVQAISGIMSVTGFPDQAPVKAGLPIGDFTAALYAALSIVSILADVTRDRSQSVFIDCPMLDCLLATAALQTSEYWGTGITPKAHGSAHPRNAPYQAYRAADTHFVLAAGNDRLWARACDVLEEPSWVDDERFATQSQRVLNQDILCKLLELHFTARPAAAWIDAFRGAGVPCGPVNTFEEILADDHVQVTGLVRRTEVPVIGQVPEVVYPARFSNGSITPRRAAPRLGAHNAEVLRDWTDA